MDADIAWDDAIPDLPVEAATSLPPLNALSSSPSDDLPNLDLLDLFSMDTPHLPPLTDKHPSRLDSPYEKLSDCTDLLSLSSPPTTTPSSPPSSTDHSESRPLAPPPRTAASPPHDLAPHPDLVAELSTRLASAGAEATSLRKRVAALNVENKSLRHALDYANARLVAVAQAASMHPPMHQPLAQQQHHHQNHHQHQPQHQRQPVMLGLTQVPSDVASRLGSVLTVSSADAPSVSTDDPRERKKRKRMAGAATTMACVMFMWGAFVGTPGLLKGSASYRSDGNLPAVWTSTPTDTAVARVMPNRRPHSAQPDHSWQPNCMRVLEQLPHGKEDLEPSTKDEPIIADPATDLDTQRQEPREDKDIDTEANKMFVDMADENAASVVARADDTEAVIPEYSYVLIRDAVAAMDSIKSCRHRLRHGNHCGQPHSISLILPASAAGLEEDVNDTQRGSIQLAEVQCTVMSVARIPSNAATVNKATPGNPNYGKVIATAGVRHAKSA